MLKVLLVDDELLIRNRLRTLINGDNRQFVICGEASDGLQALKLIRERNPDIVIFDIEMSGMNGVKLAQHISEQHAEIQMIGLSNYDTYDYVRSVLQYGAVDYLLKHRFDAETLGTVLDTCKQKIFDSKQKAVGRNEMKDEQMLPSLAKNSLVELLIGTVSEPAQLERFENQLTGSPIYMQLRNFVLVVLQVSHFELVIDRLSERDTASFIQSITDLCQQIVGDFRKGLVTYLEDGNFVVLFSLAHMRSQVFINQTITECTNQIEISLDKLINIRVRKHVSPLFQNVMKARDYYIEACLKLSSSHSGDQIHVEEMKGAYKTLSIRQEKHLLHAVEIGDDAQINKIMDEIFECDEIAFASHEIFRPLMNELFFIAKKICKNAEQSTDWMDAEVAKIQKSEMKTVKQIKDWIKQLYVGLTENLYGQMNERQSVYVKKAIQHIQEHYTEDISLESTANLLYITSSYLSRLFKYEMKMTFTEYLNQVRIEESKRLIGNKMKIKDIYKKVGFNNYSYYIRVFKDLVGETPLKYAKRKL